MIDWDRVNELQDEIGQDDFQEVVDLFLAEVEQSLDQLRGAADAKALESILHFVKGSALNIGFSDLAALCQTGETAAAAGDTETIDRNAVLQTYAASKSDFLSEMERRWAA